MVVECNFKHRELGKSKFCCSLTAVGTAVIKSYKDCAEENCILQKILTRLQGGSLPSEKYEISRPTDIAPPSQTYQPPQQQIQLQHCPFCGKQLQPDWQICGYCGKKLKGG